MTLSKAQAEFRLNVVDGHLTDAKKMATGYVDVRVIKAMEELSSFLRAALTQPEEK